MKVYETQLPGIGIRYVLQFDEGALVVLIHNDGDREVFWRAEAEGDSDRLFEIADDDAIRVANILNGTYFHPVEEGLEDLLEDARIRWIHVSEDASVAGQSVGEARIRSRSGVTILGIRRGREVLSEITPDTRIRAGDVLVAVGTDEAHETVRALLA